MSPQALDTAALALPAATLSVQWGAERVFKVGGRMFAVASPDGGLSFKATDIAYEALVESGVARPAPYLARARWVRFDDLAALDADEVAAWLATAHRLVSAKLTRAQRQALGLA
ncbi:MAG: MmcQ/YjbR family DNA-binding protein [Phenylobacterium sp.]|uniref:MmcQ/YjbR family DNA-binding protein n=1 Tax=Phenylobacterium sp. TaxID=1871053 RepID=UPI00272362AD|nr:MmcQ/YjbR family DNA-binding protein [Phenylobacterium sp.]MDO8412094.1 MmcQ/YjbR family DNA-binding protein [Phenylobacterium sp.]